MTENYFLSIVKSHRAVPFVCISTEDDDVDAADIRSMCNKKIKKIIKTIRFSDYFHQSPASSKKKLMNNVIMVK